MKDMSVNRAQRGMGTGCRTRLDSSQAMHRESPKCLSGQAMGSTVHFRKIALAAGFCAINMGLVRT